jgi:hypothetical protein
MFGVIGSVQSLTYREKREEDRMTKIVWHIRQFGPTQALQMRLQG